MVCDWSLFVEYCSYTFLGRLAENRSVIGHVAVYRSVIGHFAEYNLEVNPVIGHADRGAIMFPLMYNK